MKNLLLVKVKAVLEAVVSARHPVSLNELAKSLHLPLPTLSRLAADLVEMGLVDKVDYHHLVPGVNMLRLGDCARQNIPLLKQAIPLCVRFAETYGISFSLSGITDGVVYLMHSSNPAYADTAALWGCGTATLLLGLAGKGAEDAKEMYQSIFPNADIAEKLIFEREFESVLKQKYLFKISTMRLWSLSMPFYYHRNLCAVCFFGAAPKNIAPERFTFECAKLVAKLNQLTDSAPAAESDL